MFFVRKLAQLLGVALLAGLVALVPGGPGEAPASAATVSAPAVSVVPASFEFCTSHRSYGPMTLTTQWGPATTHVGYGAWCKPMWKGNARTVYVPKGYCSYYGDRLIRMGPLTETLPWYAPSIGRDSRRCSY